MNRNTSIERLAGLASVRDGALVSETQKPESRALLARIVEVPIPLDTATAPDRTHAPKPRRRRWLAVPALTTAVAATIAVVLVSSGENGTPTAAAATLRQAATVAGAQAPLTPDPGQYVYTKSINAYTVTTVPGDAATAYTVLVPKVREIWLGPDGGHLSETSGPPEFLTAQDRERWAAAGRPDLTGKPVEWEKLSPTSPLDLPSDTDALYARLKKDATDRGNGLYSEMFTLIGDSLRETAATPAQRAALYQVAARLPGVELIGPVKDGAGRPGTAVAISDEGIRSTLIFDPNTSALLGEEQVALAGNPFRTEAGTRIGYATYLVQKIVNSDTATS